MSLVQVSKEYLVDLNSFQFKHVNDIAGGPQQPIDIPPYIWRNSGAFEYVEDAVYRDLVGWPTNMTNRVTLNKLLVAFNLTDTYVELLIKFFDNKLWDDRVIKVKYQTTNGVNVTEELGVNFILTMNDSSQTGQCKLEKPHWVVPAFRQVNGLCHFRIDPAHYDWVPFGLMPFQYHAMYRGKPMGGSSYCLLCGPIGVLLDDDLKFDTLCILNGVSAMPGETPEIDIRRVLYTVNAYVMKFVPLKG